MVQHTGACAISVCRAPKLLSSLQTDKRLALWQSCLMLVRLLLAPLANPYLHRNTAIHWMLCLPCQVHCCPAARTSFAHQHLRLQSMSAVAEGGVESQQDSLAGQVRQWQGQVPSQQERAGHGELEGAASPAPQNQPHRGGCSHPQRPSSRHPHLLPVSGVCVCTYPPHHHQ